MSDAKETDNNLSGQSTLPDADLKTAKENKVEEVKKEEPKKQDEKKMVEMKKEKVEEKKEKSNSSKKKKEKKSKSSKSTKSRRQRLSIRRTLREDPKQDLKATLLTFQAVRGKPDQARVQLLLCNISDRDIFVKLRCNTNSNVTALPASSGHIAPKSQMRILLNWKMPDSVSQWSELPMPKILLTTYFMQHGEKTSDEAPTNTRLMARVSSSKQCDPDNSPIEQLLLDAVGKDTAVTAANPSTPNTAIPPSLTPNEPTPVKKKPAKEENEDDPENLRWIIIALVMVIVLLLLQK